MLDDQTIRIARAIALRAINDSRLTNYPQIGKEVGWHLDYGRYLGKPLKKIASFCRDNQLPLLTSIVCTTGKNTPTDEGLAYMREEFGEFDIYEEQRKVFNFDWRSVPELGLSNELGRGPNFSRLFATRSYGFNPDLWSMVGFSKDGFRSSALELIDNKPAYVVHFSSQNQQHDANLNDAIPPYLVGRISGIAEVQPRPVSSETNVEPKHRQATLERWGGVFKWPYGLEISRAWKFTVPPFARETIPFAVQDPWGPTNSIVELRESERAALTQHEIYEVDIYGSTNHQAKNIVRDPSNFTYLIVCDSTEILEYSKAPSGTKIVKIGVTSAPERRFLEISGNHIAVILGMKFKQKAVKLWSTEDRALEVESAAHDWARVHCLHASGEYFFMNEQQILVAEEIVKFGKIR